MVAANKTLGPLRLARAPGLLGHLRRGLLPRAFVDLYRAHGPILAIDMPFARLPATVLMGEKANLWAQHEARPYLRPVLPSNVTLAHEDLREALAKAYEPRHLEARLDDVLQASHEFMSAWQVGDVLPGTEVCETLVHRQTSRINFGVESLAGMREMLALERRELQTLGLGLLPAGLGRSPLLRAKQRRVRKWLHERLTQPDNTSGQLVATFMESQAAHPERLPLIDLPTHLRPAVLASKRLGDLLAFTLCTLASHPELHQLVKAEADRIFANGAVAAGDFDAQEIDIARRVYLETLRMFPPVPFLVREVMNPLSLEGRELPVGSRVLIALSTPHYLEEVFTDPSSFDIDRFLPDRSEHAQPGAFMPFGLGPGACPGENWSELHLLVNLLTFIHHFDFKVTPSCYALQLKMLPTSAPDSRFKIHITRKRSPLPTE